MRWNFVCVGLIALCFCPLARGNAETIDDTWQAALAADQRIQAARQEIAAANFTIQAAKRGYRPSITNKTSYNFLTNEPSFNFAGNSFEILDDNFATTSLMTKMPIYAGGRIAEAVDAASCLSNAAGANLQQTTLNIKLAVVTAYVVVLRSQRGVEVARANVASLTGQEEVVKSLLEQGEVPRNDLLAVQVELANARLQDVPSTLEHSGPNATKTAYNGVLGRPLNFPEIELQGFTDEEIAMKQAAVRSERYRQCTKRFCTDGSRRATCTTPLAIAAENALRHGRS